MIANECRTAKVDNRKAAAEKLYVVTRRRVERLVEQNASDIEVMQAIDRERRAVDTLLDLIWREASR